MGQCCVWIPAQQKFGQPTLSLLPPQTQLSVLGPLGAAMLSGALKWLKCFLRCFQQTASSSELMQNQGKQSALIHKTNELSKQSSSRGDH